MTDPAPEPADDSGFDAELLSVFAIDGADVPAIEAAPAGAEPTPAPSATPAPAEPPVTPTPEPSPEAPPAKPAPAELPGLEQTPSPAPAPAPTPSEPPAQDEAALRFASMQAQLEAAQAENARLRQAPPAAPAPGPTGEPAAEAPQYALSIPDQVAAAIFNEDPTIAKQGLNHLVNSLATIIHTKVRADYQEAIAGFRHELSAGDQQQRSRAEAEAMQTDYFSAFPTHKAPVYEPIITQVAAKMAAEFPGAPWNENYRNTLGARVNAAVAELNGQPQVAAPAPVPAPVPVTPSAPPAKPAAFVPTSPRPAVVTVGEEATPDAVAELFAAGD